MPAAGRIDHRNGAEIDRLIGELAARRHGIVTWAEPAAIGMTRRMVESRVRRAFLIRLHPGVFAVGHRPITQEARWLAGVLACGDGAVLSHRSAAALHGVRQTSSPSIDVTAPSRRGYTLENVVVHRATTLQPSDRGEVRGIPVTSLPRTIIDLATCVSPGSLEYAIHSAERRRLVTPGDLRDALDRLPGVSGTAAVRKIVGRPGHDLDARTRSRWELRFLDICRTHQLPMPRSTSGSRSTSRPAGSRSTSTGRPSGSWSRSTSTEAIRRCAHARTIPNATPPYVPRAGGCSESPSSNSINRTRLRAGSFAP
jgi:predicted transcriptional regulator of viral defense system